MGKKSENPHKGLSLPVIIISGVFGAVLIAGTIFALRYIVDTSSPSLRSSQRLFEKGKHEEALSVLDKVSSNGQSAVKKYVLRAEILLAIVYEQLQEEQWGSYGIDPDNWIASPLATEAEQCLLTALEIEPQHRDALFLLGTLYKKQGRFNSALQQFRYLSDLYSQDVEVKMALGILFASMEKYSSAEKQLLAAWKMDNKNPKTAKNLAFLYRYHMDMPESSMVWFNKYLNLNPQGDLDVNIAKKELMDLIDRYPEFSLPDSQYWKETGRKFKPRF